MPQLSKGQGWSFQEFSRRRGDYALMGVAVFLTVDGQGFCRKSRLVFLNAGDAPVNTSLATDVLNGQAPTDELFKEAARAAAYDVINPVANIHASVPYLRHLAFTLTLRGLDSALKRAMDSLE
jgi:CO/xanthine dehydrogenase FAD-binding subunit